MAIPVTIATNGLGLPVRAVDGGAPVMQVASNGLSIPIVLSDLGVPFVVLGGEPAVEALPSIATTPSAGWGFRRLNAAYTGPLFRAVRPSDSATRDIAQASDGTPELTGFAAWAGSEAIQVDLVYDQYGTNHLAQTTAANRPLFYAIDAVRGKMGATMSGGKRWDIPIALTGDGRATTTVDVGFAMTGNSGGGFAQLGQTYNGAGSMAILLGNGSGGNGRVRMLNTAFVATDRYPYAQPQVIASSQGAQNVVHINDVVRTVAANSAGTWSGGTIGRVSVPYEFTGQWFSRVIYPATLGLTDVASLKAALYSMFDINPNPAVQIIWPGNSIVQGTSSVRNIWNNARQAEPAINQRVEIINIGRFGWSASGQYDERAAYYGARRTDRRNFLVTPEPTNDIEGRSAANVAGFGTTAWDTLVRPFITEAVAAGFTAIDILVPTTLPRNWTGDASLKAAKEAERIAYNTLVRDNMASLGYTVVDYAAIPAMADPLGPNYADGTHPNSTNFASGLEVSGNGYGYMAKLFADVVNARLSA